jgi:hypothetical protein
VARASQAIGDLNTLGARASTMGRDLTNPAIHACGTSHHGGLVRGDLSAFALMRLLRCR